MCLERKKGRVYKMRYRICFDESKEGYNEMKKGRLYSVRISDE